MIIKELSQALENMNTADIISMGRIFCFVVSALGYCKIFQKAGEAGWKLLFLTTATLFALSSPGIPSRSGLS